MRARPYSFPEAEVADREECRLREEPPELGAREERAFREGGPATAVRGGFRAEGRENGGGGRKREKGAAGAAPRRPLTPFPTFLATSENSLRSSASVQLLASRAHSPANAASRNSGETRSTRVLYSTAARVAASKVRSDGQKAPNLSSEDGFGLRRAASHACRHSSPRAM